MEEAPIIGSPYNAVLPLVAPIKVQLILLIWEGGIKNADVWWNHKQGRRLAQNISVAWVGDSIEVNFTLENSEAAFPFVLY